MVQIQKPTIIWIKKIYKLFWTQSMEKKLEEIWSSYKQVQVLLIMRDTSQLYKDQHFHLNKNNVYIHIHPTFCMNTNNWHLKKLGSLSTLHIRYIMHFACLWKTYWTLHLLPTSLTACIKRFKYKCKFDVAFNRNAIHLKQING